MSITVAAQMNSLSIKEPLTVVVGASGDLPQTKVIPALFALFCQGYMPEHFSVVGFARSDYSDDAFRQLLDQHLSVRCHSTEDANQEQHEKFLSRCFSCQGQYNQVDSFTKLATRLEQMEGRSGANRMVYMAIPPSVFTQVARAIKQTGIAGGALDKPWTRVIIEKPFGADRASSDQLVRDMGDVFAENQTFRIDHYLGKEVLQNLMVLRFANLIFEPLRNRNYIDHVQISWKQPIGVGNRAGYFDDFGIIRDVMQNHFLQMMALTAIEPPSHLNAQSIRDETVKALRCVRPLTMDNVAKGQYGRGKTGDVSHAAFLEKLKVPPDSRAATFAAAVLHVHNWRWEGVPFFLRAGKAWKHTRQKSASGYAKCRAIFSSRYPMGGCRMNW